MIPGAARLLISKDIDMSFQTGNFENISDMNLSHSGLSLARWNSSRNFNIRGLLDVVSMQSSTMLYGFTKSSLLLGTKLRIDVIKSE